MPAQALIFAWGNPSRGDDALGLEFLARIEALAGPGLELLTDFQLQLEHAADLRCRALVLFVDASVSCAAPFGFQRVRAGRDASFTSHAMSHGDGAGRVPGYLRRWAPPHGTTAPPRGVTLACRI